MAEDGKGGVSRGRGEREWEALNGWVGRWDDRIVAGRGVAVGTGE